MRGAIIVMALAIPCIDQECNIELEVKKRNLNLNLTKIKKSLITRT